MDYFVQCGTTAILNRNLPALADQLRGELQHTGYVHEPTIVSNLLTRRLTLRARIEAGTPQTAITVAETALLSYLRGHGAEYVLVGIQHADATPAEHSPAPDAHADRPHVAFADSGHRQ
ncbi:MAG: hypothetical protein QOH74_1096 [Gaiellales bacterium]|jgi:hypothetical protein|nr:hypothetical protein [Gaiellales bacterium]MDX6599544.1 hypothetical protein [Gaiellales bacterium]